MAPQSDPLQRLAVLVVNYGSHDVVEPNLTRSLGPEFPGQVIVIDNFSTEPEREAMRGVCKRHGWTLLALDTNEGFGGGNNRGAELALSRGATELLLLNPDAWLTEDTVRRMHQQVAANPLLQLAPVVSRPDGSFFGAEVDLHLELGEMRATWRRPADADPDQIHTWVSGACFMMSAQLWQQAGGFDEDYFLYWEDVDLSRRVVQLGGTVRADPELTAVHDEGTTHRLAGASRAKSPIYYYYNARNRLLYAAKLLPREDGRRWLRRTPLASYRILLQGGRRQFVHPGRTIWPALRGSFDGLRLWRTHTAASGTAASGAAASGTAAGP